MSDEQADAIPEAARRAAQSAYDAEAPIDGPAHHDRALDAALAAAAPFMAGSGEAERLPTHVCGDCGALGYAGGYHDHGDGNAGDTFALAHLPSVLRSLQAFESRAYEAEAELERLRAAQPDAERKCETCAPMQCDCDDGPVCAAQPDAERAPQHCTTCGHPNDLHSPGGDHLCRGQYADRPCECQFFTTAPRDGADAERAPQSKTLGLSTKRECGVETQDLGEPIGERAPQGEYKLGALDPRTDKERRRDEMAEAERAHHDHSWQNVWRCRHCGLVQPDAERAPRPEPRQDER